MQKRKPPRAAVRNTPQPKAHSYIPAVFVDHFGRDRVLNVATAKAFAKKKLDAASRALDRRSNRAMDKAIEAGDRETAKAIRRLRAQERQADREREWFFRRLMRTKVRLEQEIKHKPPKEKQSIWPYRSSALPKYDGPILDRLKRRGVFFRSRYYSSRTAKPGVSKRVTVYIYKGSALDVYGDPMVRTNVGLSIEETVCGLDHHEQVNRSAQKNAKVLNHAVLAMDYRWTPEQMLEVGERWAQDSFGQFGLPFVISLHAPPPEGDERNWHVHAIWSWRPLERVGDHEWLVGESLRTDLDGAQGMWMLRERFAAAMTEMSLEAGNTDIYTALSYAARGLPVEPQIHLDEGRTRCARDGEFVEANEENHERVLRSKAALAEDKLRRQDERLARRQKIIRRAAERFSISVKTPSMPTVRATVSDLSDAVKTIRAETPKLAAQINSAATKDFPTQLAFNAHIFTDRMVLLVKRMWDMKIANLRFSAVSETSFSPRTPFSKAYKTSSFQPIMKTPAPVLTRTLDVPIPPERFKVQDSFATNFQRTIPLPVSISVMPKPPYSLPKVGTDFWAISYRSSVPAFSRGISPVTVPPIVFRTVSFTVPKTAPAFSNARVHDTSAGIPQPVRSPTWLTTVKALQIQQRAPFQIIEQAKRDRIERAISNAYLALKVAAQQVRDDGDSDELANTGLSKTPGSNEPSTPANSIRASLDRLYEPRAKKSVAKPGTEKSVDTKGTGPVDVVKQTESDNTVSATVDNRSDSDRPASSDWQYDGSVPYRRNAKGKLVIKPLTDQPETMGARQVVEDTESIAAAKADAQKKDREAAGVHSKNNLPDHMLNDAVTSQRNLPTLELVRGLHFRIDAWIHAEERNDRAERRKQAAAIYADKIAREIVRTLNARDRARFQRDWDANTPHRTMNLGRHQGNEPGQD